MRRRNFVSLVASAGLAGCFESREPGDSRETRESPEIDEYRETDTRVDDGWRGTQPADSVSIGTTTVRVGVCSASRAVRYFDESSQSVEYVEPERGWWAAPWIFVDNPRNEEIDFPAVDGFALAAGGGAYLPIEEFDGIESGEFRGGAGDGYMPLPWFPGDTESEHVTVGAGAERSMSPYFDVPVLDDLAVMWNEEKAALSVDSVSVAGDA